MWKAATKQITGTNDVPLGTRRRFGPAPSETSAPPQLAQPSPSAFPRAVENDNQPKRQREETPTLPEQDPGAPRKRRSRWGDAKTELPGLPTAIAANNVSQAQLDNYAIQLRLEEINRKLRLNDYIPPEKERSPSPPPIYDAQGRRSNTREVRYKKKLEDERVRLVERALKTDPNFRPPIEYHQQKRLQRPQEKVYIPVKEFPEVNFFGLLVGPRGNSLKAMERESGAKISIRGKGSVKEGKNKSDAYGDDSEEDLHCLVMAETEDKVAHCVRLINKVIETAASTPEGQNDHKRNQLRELAALNGTLRDDENQVCQNCGNVGHRKYDCPEQRNFTAGIVCRICGSAGHMARDCTVKRDPNALFNGSPTPPQQQPGMPGQVGGYNGQQQNGFDSEYASLMAELGEGHTGGNDHAKPSWGTSAPGLPQVASSDLPPWRRPEVWQTSNPQPVNQGYRPPYPGGYPGYSAAAYSAPVHGQTAVAAYPGHQTAPYGGQQDYASAYAQYYQQQYAQQQTTQ